MLPSDVCHTYSELHTAVDKGRDRGAALLSGGTGALHGGSGCVLRHGTRVLYCWQKQTNRASMYSPYVSARERSAVIPLLVYGRLEFTV
ncbi:hypothetical protein Y032_0176g568 [Ancylostoma ceylanicum]|uniref:Uncharacterized protein n=1 Tax=Ancylostoma ceylanicum TaxID=53326 RepID=A0A016SUL5_9BILA|nr:hypothetical protein Y032_0176g568 [Ancylostoma ceylanicum]